MDRRKRAARRSSLTLAYTSHFLLGVCALIGLLVELLPNKEVAIVGSLLLGIPILVVGGLAILGILLGSLLNPRTRVLAVLGGVLVAFIGLAVAGTNVAGKLQYLMAFAMVAYLVLALLLPVLRFRPDRYWMAAGVTLGALTMAAFAGRALGLGTRMEGLSECYVRRHVEWDPIWGPHSDLLAKGPDGSLDYCGSIVSGAWDKPFSGDAFSGLQQVPLALSSDGRSIVFRLAFDKRWFPREPGIWHHSIDQGGELVIPASDLREGWRRWARLPSDVLPYELAGKYDPDAPYWAVTAGGETLPLALVGGTALHHAAWHGQVDRIAMLLDAGEEVDVVTYWGLTPLHVAVLRNQDAAALLLLERGADPEVDSEQSAEGFDLVRGQGVSKYLERLRSISSRREERTLAGDAQ